MFKPKQNEVWAAEIADYLNKPLLGENFLLTDFTAVRTEGAARKRADRGGEPGDKILVISERPITGLAGVSQIVSPHAELDIALTIREFFSIAPVNEVDPSAHIAGEAKIGRNVMVGPFSVIGPNVEIGDNTQIFSHVIINGPARIGRWCTLKDGAVIGSEGWGFIIDEEGGTMHPPHLGRIAVEDHVWIGSNSTVERPLSDATIIAANAKIDDLVHIGADAYVGENCEILAGSIISRNVRLERNVRIAPRVVVREDRHIGEGALIGLGSVVVKDLEAGGIYVGNPARFLRVRPR